MYFCWHNRPGGHTSVGGEDEALPPAVTADTRDSEEDPHRLTHLTRGSWVVFPHGVRPPLRTQRVHSSQGASSRALHLPCEGPSAELRLLCGSVPGVQPSLPPAAGSWPLLVSPCHSPREASVCPTHTQVRSLAQSSIAHASQAQQRSSCTGFARGSEPLPAVSRAQVFPRWRS